MCWQIQILHLIMVLVSNVLRLFHKQTAFKRPPNDKTKHAPAIWQPLLSLNTDFMEIFLVEFLQISSRVSFKVVR